MNGIERLQAAIDKLERIRAESTSGPWVLEAFSGIYSGSFDVTSSAGNPVTIGGFDNWEDPRPAIEHAADAELIVTLHRTIDAQLAILRDAETYGDGNGPGHSYESSAASAAVWALALPLADAILGGTS